MITPEDISEIIQTRKLNKSTDLSRLSLKVLNNRKYKRNNIGYSL